MHLHRERLSESGALAHQAASVPTVRLSRDDVEAIDLALRVLLAASSPRDTYFLELTRARAKFADLDERGIALVASVPGSPTDVAGTSEVS